MKLLTDIDVGGHTITKTDNSNWKLNLTINSKELGGSGDTGQCTNVSWANHLLETLVRNSTGSPKALSEMPSATSSGSHIPSNEDCGIRDVWCHNLEEEFRTIRQVVQKYNYVAMDTEFPGVVARPIGEFRSTADYQYQLLRCNVDLLRIIQLGLTFLDENGKTPGGSYTTWQFNFKFNLSEDMYAQDSIDLLQNSGIQFKKHEEEGIDPLEFAELLMTSGVVLMDNIKWLSFHSGYDFGYLIKLLTDQNLPHEESEFFELLRLYFPTIYDVKYLMKSCKNLKGGLQEVADQLDLARVGPQHQAGSDSLLTGMAFFKMKEMFFEDNIDDSKYRGHLYGLGTSFIMNGNFHDNGDNSSSS
ncbi:CCR4-NOT transcription complex subunit 7 [Chrysoperla carnea]|uniref:CCR4-NOT transcription complex subunit 7 n=1 Tax=Chrysoperla carnea TaxID=189513 RepID=UPI001D0765C0|nr:CCR4-NOT transcription complex subunit 7 [Chrysoperla carnea]XP_044730384.1 CCR4-NOT transcription complex subunit 7 [Chrysoperla carnea]XP_044730385.1 CCR4-NOT transcription complex subunit 7 [Chrysoperla carnea]XP_044730386.1 CCR4-NOT transcription complex subunit 7 [Chrysoperla carnea]XP_044730387.1 CCR4-NOT transcription complex subunit 7 [Chrysoperla carnea]